MCKHSHNSNGIVVKDGGHIFRGEFVGRVADQKTGLANSTITDNYTPVRTQSALLPIDSVESLDSDGMMPCASPMLGWNGWDH